MTELVYQFSLRTQNSEEAFLGFKPSMDTFMNRRRGDADCRVKIRKFINGFRFFTRKFT